MGTPQAISVSPVKRERMKKQRLLLLKQNMRAELPILNKNEIRRFRLPYYEAILEELNEQGFTSSEQFLRQLIQYQEDLRRENGPESVVSARPRLIENHDTLNLLHLGFKNAENAHYQDDLATEIQEFIKLSVHFGLGPVDWWWLGEQMLIQTVNISGGFMKDGGKRQTLVTYIYGKFLLENMEDAKKAKTYLTTARKLSTGKTWTAAHELGYKQESIFIESCILLYKALLAEAKEILKFDPLKAARICAIARKRAIDACHHEGEADALMLQGLCEMDAGDANAAITSFIKVLLLYTKVNKKKGICEARIHAAFAYQKIGKSKETLNQLEKLLQYAQENNFPYYVAQAYRFLGEFYLNQGLPHLATPLLIKALQNFHDIEDILNREQARNLAAISAGQELIPKYVELILKSGKGGLKGLEYVLKLVKWKDTRELFWTDSNENTLSYSSSVIFDRLHFLDENETNEDDKMSGTQSVEDKESQSDDERVVEIIQMDD